MTAKAPAREIALELGLTERRIRQLIHENILPRDEDGFDRDLCRYRYRLFSRGADADWEGAYNHALEVAGQAEELIAQALGTSSSLVDVARACESTQALMSDMRFIVAARSASQSERQFFCAMWDRYEASILEALLARAQELTEQVGV